MKRFVLRLYTTAHDTLMVVYGLGKILFEEREEGISSAGSFLSRRCLGNGGSFGLYWLSGVVCSKFRSEVGRDSGGRGGRGLSKGLHGTDVCIFSLNSCQLLFVSETCPPSYTCVQHSQQEQACMLLFHECKGPGRDLRVYSG